MKTLLWKEYKQNYPIVLGGVMLLSLPYVALVGGHLWASIV